MMLSKEKKAEIAEKFGNQFGKNAGDTGNTAVQIALLTNRINTLKDHFSKHAHDHHSSAGLLKMIGHRRSLLKYYRAKNEEKYKKLILELGLRK